VLQGLRGRGLCEELSLELLCPEDVGAYVAARLDGKAPAELAALIYHRTEGNALFMVNMLEHFVEQGVIKQEGGQWTIRDHHTVAPSVPDALQLLITKRFEMLARAEQRVLEVASIVGDVFATATVAAGLEVPVAHVDAICDTLGHQHAFLEPAGLEEWPDGTLSGCYRFQHALYRQVLAERLGEIRRIQVHRCIGARLEQSYGPQTPMISTQLACHFAHGRAPHRAVQYLYQAGEQALHHGAYYEARRHFEAGLELLRLLPDTLERTRQEVALLLALGAVLMATEGLAASEVLHTYRQAHMLCAQGEYGLARDLAKHCYALAQDLHERTYPGACAQKSTGRGL
jgi:predicted ATPase